MANWHRLDRQSFALLFARRSSSLLRLSSHLWRRNQFLSRYWCYYLSWSPGIKSLLCLWRTGRTCPWNSSRFPGGIRTNHWRGSWIGSEPFWKRYFFIFDVLRFYNSTLNLASMLSGNFTESSFAQAAMIQVLTRITNRLRAFWEEPSFPL